MGWAGHGKREEEAERRQNGQKYVTIIKNFHILHQSTVTGILSSCVLCIKSEGDLLLKVSKVSYSCKVLQITSKVKVIYYWRLSGDP